MNGLQASGSRLRACNGCIVHACLSPESEAWSLTASASIERNVGLRVGRADVFGARTDQPVVRVLLEHVRRPAGDAADGEHRREQIRRNAERVVRGRRVEIDVGVQLLLAPSPASRSAAKSGTTRGCRTSVPSSSRHLPQMRRARIFGAVHAMAEARDLLFPGQLRADRSRRSSDPSRPRPSSSSRCMTSVLAPPCSGPFSAPIAPVMAECTSVSVAAATRADERGRVELVIGVQHQRHVQRARCERGSAGCPSACRGNSPRGSSAGSGAMMPPPAASRPDVATTDAQLRGQP